MASSDEIQDLDEVLPQLPRDEKFIVFKREDFYQLMGELALPPDMDWMPDDTDCAPLAENIIKRCEETKLDDAVVIRTRDIFAGPCLHTYAAMLDWGGKIAFDGDMAADFRKIGDYFADRAMEADNGPNVFPTP